ncbi:hypothetical protein LCM20_15185 [Halobacillus litoralis]|uniref:hypothetical protein n=1 Tax=Halobacillus litoralis TaxID=45668 RepID=UPI001CD3DFED|nr:hypothetical protein [Halobacillus litoralis]MCA0971948.1 hypothetical protein [Halobacillus litoralis]
MSRYLQRIEPEEVRFLLDFTELEKLVVEMLGEAKDLVTIEISYDQMEDFTGAEIIRPMVKLREISKLNEEQRHLILNSGFSIDREPFDNGDYAMEEIFGPEYTIASATNDADGPFFTIEMPYRFYVEEKEQH